MMTGIGERAIKSSIEMFRTLFEENLPSINKEFSESANFVLTFTVKIKAGENGNYLEPGISIPRGAIKDSVDKYFISEEQMEMFEGEG